MQQPIDMAQPSISTTDSICSPIQADLHAVNALILKEIDSRVPLVKAIAQHLIQSGGKRIRPIVTLLCTRALDYKDDTEHHELATIIEFIHTATLLHDDVIDISEQRRGTPTANALWNNSAAVLVGDFLYSRAFQILARRSNIPVMKVLADATNRLSEAEILQMTLAHNPDMTEQDYFTIIDGKTAQLYSAASHVGALLATDDIKKQEALRDFGTHLGLAFQIIDDILDYSANQKTLGKNLGDDLTEGKTTLPLIIALKNSDKDQQAIIRNAIKEGKAKDFDAIIQILERTHAIELSWNVAHDFVNKAKENLTVLSSSTYKSALLQLANFVINRNY